MHAFNSLTPRGQVRRLRALAHTALDAYPIAVRRLSLLAVHTNTLFRVDGADGDRYVLRISTPGQHSLNDNLVELAWLTCLARDRVADVVTPSPTVPAPILPTSRCRPFPKNGAVYCLIGSLDSRWPGG